jgi:hypothetical protein
MMWFGKNMLGLVVEGMEAPLRMVHQQLNYAPRPSHLCLV